MKYICDGQKTEKDKLCIENEDGEFENKDLCEKTCLNRVLDNEIADWKNLFTELFKLNINIYCKGGSTLGLVVLQQLLIKAKEQKSIPLAHEMIETFGELRLIKDWDFTILLEPPIEYQTVISIGERFNFKNEANLFPILRRRPNIKIAGEHLFELSIKNHENISDLELPLTTLKFKITPVNIDNFFILTKYFLDLEKIEIPGILEIINTFDFNSDIRSIKDGFFNIEDTPIDYGGLSEPLIEILNSMTREIEIEEISPENFIQFLVTQFKEPDRLIVRFFGKNIKKSKKIKDLFNMYKITLPSWLLDDTKFEKIKKLVDIFLLKINNYINHIFDRELYDSCIEFMTHDIKYIYDDPFYKIGKNKRIPSDSRILCVEKMKVYHNKLTNFFRNVNLGRMDKYVSEPEYFNFFISFVPNEKIKMLYDEIIKINDDSANLLKPAKKKKITISNLLSIKHQSKYSNFISVFKPWEKQDNYKQKYNKYKIKYLRLKKMME